MNNKMKLAIVGSRDFTDYSLFRAEVDKYTQNISLFCIVSGGCRGTDTLAETYAKEKNIPLVIYPAKWEIYGRKAGPLRNQQICDNSDICLAFVTQDSIGTWNTIRKFQNAGKSVTIIKV